MNVENLKTRAIDDKTRMTMVAVRTKPSTTTKARVPSPCHYPATHWVDLTPATHWVDCQNLWYMGVGLITRFFLVSIIDMELLIHRVIFFFYFSF